MCGGGCIFCVCVCLYLYLCGVQLYPHECIYSGKPEALELELRAVVSHLTWFLGIKSGLSARQVHALNHCAISEVRTPEIY